MTTRDSLLDLSPETTDLPLVVTSVMGQELDLEGTPLKGLAVRVNVGYTTDNTLNLVGTFNVIAHGASSSGVASSDGIIGQFDAPVVISSETAGYRFEKIFPITTPLRFVRLEYAIAGLAASDSPSFSLVEAFAGEQVGLDWDRNINFH